MKKMLLKLAVAAALGCGLVSSLCAWSTSWNSNQSSWMFTSVNVPSTCSVSIDVYVSGYECNVWGLVWGDSNGFNKGEFRSTNHDPESWSYGSPTADLYYVEVDTANYWGGYGAVDFSISW